MSFEISLSKYDKKYRFLISKSRPKLTNRIRTQCPKVDQFGQI
jgi:hypothetical protein